MVVHNGSFINIFIPQIKEYLVKWQGYNSDENTWEPRKNLKKGTIDEFEQQKQLEKFKNVAGRTMIYPIF